MHVLLITPTFPPYQGSHTERMVAMANTLIKNGFSVSVLTNEILAGNPTYNPVSMESINPKIKVYRCKFGLLHRTTYKKNSDYTSIKYKKGKNIRPNTLQYKLKNVSVKFIEKVKKRYIIPDSLIDWYFPVIKYVRKNKLFTKFHPDYIISCSMPNSCHVISYKLSKKYNIPMIMDIADPWVYLSYYNRGKFIHFIEKKMEQKYLHHSVLISFSTEGCEKKYIEKYPNTIGKTMTVVTGYNPELLEVTKETKTKENQNTIIHFIYGGALQTGVRNPTQFLEVISTYSSNEIDFLIRTDNVDQINSIIKNNTNIFVESYIAFEKFYQELLNSDVLVFFGNTTEDQLPGKIFNYIPTGKLIFYISNIEEEKDQALNIVKNYGHFIMVKNEKSSIKCGIDKVLQMKKNEQLNKKVDNHSIIKYSSEEQFAKLAKKINLITHERAQYR